MTTLYAQPYDICASGFYFDSAEAYHDKVSSLRNEYGQPVEEFEIQFIDGAAIDAELFDALKIHQGDFRLFLDAVDQWDDEDKTKVIIAVRDTGYDFNLAQDEPGKFEIDLYECDTLRDLAIQFVDEGYFGDIPKAIENYLDYDAVARDLSMDYGSAEVAGTRYIYRMG
jgi:hypothetical protein